MLSSSESNEMPDAQSVKAEMEQAGNDARPVHDALAKYAANQS